MSIINSQPLIGASGNQGGYTIAKSLRLRASASAYLSRTFGTPTNQNKWTYSVWVKPSTIVSNIPTLISADTSSSTSINFLTDSTLQIGWSGGSLTTSQVFRDPSSWYHIVVYADTTNATASNRLKLYINGSEVTAFSTDNRSLLGSGSLKLNAAYLTYIGTNPAATPRYFDGYLADQYFIDGQNLTPSLFGETDSITGVWKPKAYSGTYGTNGFYLKFTDVATTSGSNAGLGKDFSGNGNYWTTNNISVTSGATYDSMKDVPTLTDTDTANFCTLNPVASNIALTNGNLVLPDGGSGFESRCAGTIGFSSGKFYFEDLVGGTYFNNQIGIYLADKAVANATLRYTILQNGNKYDGTTQTSYGSTYASGDIIGVAVDLDSGKIWFSINGTFQASGNPASGTNAAFTGLTGTHLPFFTGYNNGSGTSTNTVNFGQRPFAYTPPTGYKALNTYNLPNSTIVAGNKVMDATLATGTGTTQVITNSGGFKPDFIWSKQRNGANDNYLTDSVRGASKYLVSNSTAAEGTADFISSFNSNGFTFGTNNYASAQTSVNWQWQAGQGSTSSNTNGSITSTVSVNASAGFSIATYTGNGTSGATIGHGLGVAPSMIIAKKRSAGAQTWSVYHSALGNTKAIFLNETSTPDTNAVYWNNTSPTSTVWSSGSGANQNASGATYVAYCWSEVEGFSKFGSYTGNGSTDGPFIYLGFRPKFWMAKRTDVGAPWLVYDSSRNTSNVVNNYLLPNASDAEGSGSSPNDVNDFLSNGFKVRCSNLGENASGGTFIYMAFAENPFKNSLAR